MIITGKRKRTLDKRFQALAEGTTITPGIPLNEDTKNKLLAIGFPDKPKLGDTVLPEISFGPVTRYNAIGKTIIHRDQPMETAYRQVEWHWRQWAGYGSTEEHSKIVDVPYERYPRSLDPPPGIELSIRKDKEGKYFIVAPALELNKKNTKELIHEINIFLEIFGYCQIFTEALRNLVPVKIVRLNWRILPPGRWPWDKVKNEVKPIIKKTSPQNQIVITHRLQAITKYNPEFVAIGMAGFTGYLIFGFPKKNLYVLEAVYTGNATYVFEDDWEELSRLTKAEIITGKLQKDRIIHREGWNSRIEDILEQ